MSSIVPTVVPKRQTSPTSTGWSATRLTLPKKFSTVFCAASATARPPTPRPAISPVTLKPKFWSAAVTASMATKTLSVRRPSGTVATARACRASRRRSKLPSEHVQHAQHEPGERDDGECRLPAGEEALHRHGERQRGQAGGEDRERRPRDGRARPPAPPGCRRRRSARRADGVRRGRSVAAPAVTRPRRATASRTSPIHCQRRIWRKRISKNGAGRTSRERPPAELLVERGDGGDAVGGHLPHRRPVGLGDALERQLHGSRPGLDRAERVADGGQPVVLLALGLVAEPVRVDPQRAVEDGLELRGPARDRAGRGRRAGWDAGSGTRQRARSVPRARPQGTAPSRRAACRDRTARSRPAVRWSWSTAARSRPCPPRARGAAAGAVSREAGACPLAGARTSHVHTSRF